MYILYKEISPTFPATVTCIGPIGGRSLCELAVYDKNGKKIWEDDTFNYLKGNVKVITEKMVKLGMPNYGKHEVKYYTNGKDKDDIDFEKTSVMGETTTHKVHREYTADEFEATIGLQKIVLTANVEDVFDVRFKTLQKNKPEMETTIWPAQSKEANAYKADNTVDTPVLTKLAETRGITVSDLADKIVTKEAEYNIAVAELLGQQQKLIDEIKACTQIYELLKWNEDNFGIMAPTQNIMEWYPDLVDENNVRKVSVVQGVKF